MIQDYTTYISEIGGYGLNTKIQNRELFFHNWEKCKYCNGQINTVFSKGLVDLETIVGVNFHKSEEVIKCNSCGWWQHKFHSYLDGDMNRLKDWQIEVSNAILRTFEIGSNLTPIMSLRNYLESNKEKVFEIHHKKMEELVASVFNEHYKCEVKIIGKSSDGGIDLILINSDNPIMVQVKRRTKKNKTVSVKEIRDLLGATLLKGARNCAFVTTADHFSTQAITATNEAIVKDLVTTFELYDFNRFFNILNSLSSIKKSKFQDLIRLKD